MSLSFPDASTPYWIQDGSVNSTLPTNGTQLILQKNETELVYAAPVPNRCWCDLNNGRLLWPVLSGYQYLDSKLNDTKVKRDLRKWRKERSMSGRPTRTQDAEPASTPEDPVVASRIAESSEAKETPATARRRLSPYNLFKRHSEHPSTRRPSRTEAYDPLIPEDPYHEDPLMNWDGVGPVPAADAPKPTARVHRTSLLTPAAASWWSSLLRSRYDLRVHGCGMVVDFGLTRTEEDVKEEVMEMLDWTERQRGQEVQTGEDEEETSEEAESVDESLLPTRVPDRATPEQDALSKLGSLSPPRKRPWLSYLAARRDKAVEEL